MENVQRVVSVAFDPVSGVVDGGYGASVAVVTPSRVWDLTFDPDTAGAYDESGVDAYFPQAFVRSPVGALGRTFVYERSGSALRVSCVDFAGAAADAAATVLVNVDRMFTR